MRFPKTRWMQKSKISHIQPFSLMRELKKRLQSFMSQGEVSVQLWEFQSPSFNMASAMWMITKIQGSQLRIRIRIFLLMYPAIKYHTFPFHQPKQRLRQKELKISSQLSDLKVQNYCVFLFLNNFPFLICLISRTCSGWELLKMYAYPAAWWSI